MGLFLERGYEAVTIAEIAERAGLSKRSFFNHFPDKREILYADAEAFEQTIAQHLAAAAPTATPLHAALTALTVAGTTLSAYAATASARRDLIASSVELEERNLQKLATLARLLTDGLQARGTPPRQAALTAHTAIVIFNTAYDDWVDQPDTDFAGLIEEARRDLQIVLQTSPLD